MEKIEEEESRSTINDTQLDESQFEEVKLIDDTAGA
jgi:hypothetical protein